MRSLVAGVCLLLIALGALADSDKPALVELGSDHTAIYRSASIAPDATSAAVEAERKSNTARETDGISGPEARYPTSEILMEEICQAMADAAQDHNLPVPFFARLIWQESRFLPHAVSPAGARGIAQFMPRIAAALQLEDPFNPITALPVSARFLQEHVETFGNLGLAAAAYNAGTRRVRDWLAKRGKLSRETQKYVVAITGHPPEQWTAPKSLEIPQDLPAQAPCEGVAELSRNAEASRVHVQLGSAIATLIATAKAKPAKLKGAKARAAKPAARANAKGKAKAPPAKLRVAAQIGPPH